LPHYISFSLPLKRCQRALLREADMLFARGQRRRFSAASAAADAALTLPLTTPLAAISPAHMKPAAAFMPGALSACPHFRRQPAPTPRARQRKAQRARCAQQCAREARAGASPFSLPPTVVTP